jgi:predicted DNA-binding protein
MAKEKTYKIRFSDWEWQRLESAAKRRNVPIAQVIREGLTLALDKEPQAS